MQLHSAYLLVSHGSRGVRPQVAIEQLAKFVQSKLPASSGIVGTAALECTPLPLHEQIRRFNEQVASRNIEQIFIVPLFLLPGVHVMEDIPEQIEIAKQSLNPAITLTLLPHLGTHPELKTLLARRLDKVSADTCILLSHGSRRSGGNFPIETLATTLGAVTAYWSVSPSLESRVEELVEQGCQQIAILPYFLFSGGITDAIAQSVRQLAEQFPDRHLILLSPLDVSDDLADLVVNFITAQNPPHPVMQSSR